MVKRALMIGLNYPGTDYELNGCVNDVTCLKQVLVSRFGFPAQNIKLLLDTEGHDKPTLNNILENLNRIVQETRTGDVLFLHYSGHGTQIPDDGSDESDGKDEALVSGDGVPLRDDVLQAALAKLPPGVKMTFVADCCHSGTMLDQPMQQVSGSKSVAAAHAPAANRNIKHRGLKFAQFKQLAGQLQQAAQGGGINADVLNSVLGNQLGGLAGGLLSNAQANNIPVDKFLGFLRQNCKPAKVSSAPPPENLEAAVLISGCQDTETSADAFINGSYNGALTNAIQTVLSKSPGQNVSNKQLCVLVREHLKASGYAQNPCLSCSTSQIDQPFICAI